MNQLDGTVGIPVFRKSGIKQPDMGRSDLNHFHPADFIPHTVIPRCNVIAPCTVCQFLRFYIPLKQCVDRQFLCRPVGYDTIVHFSGNLPFFLPERCQISVIDCDTLPRPFIGIAVHIQPIFSLGFSNLQISSSIIFSCHKIIPFCALLVPYLFASRNDFCLAPSV